MKVIKVFITLLLVTAGCLYGQVETGDQTEILLKNGYTVRGKIIENITGEKVTILTIDGFQLTYAYTEIDFIGKASNQKIAKKQQSDLFDMNLVRLTANLGFGLTGLSGADNCYNCEPKSVFKFPQLIGVGARYDVDTLLSIHAELNYERKGYKFEYSGSIDDHKQLLSYLTLPIYAGANFKFEDLLIFGQLGLYAGLKLNEKVKNDNNQYYGYYGHKSIDFGMLVSAGIEIPYQERTSIRVQLRHTRGFISSLERYNMKNKSFVVMISAVHRMW